MKQKLVFFFKISRIDKSSVELTMKTKGGGEKIQLKNQELREVITSDLKEIKMNKEVIKEH